MSRKAFLVKVELDIQAVTCPGVWLCSNGKVALQIYMLDSCVQTSSYKPNFPVQCNETFVFYKTFYSKHQLNELEKELHDQWFYIELVQWQSCEIGTVLATFKTTLNELLYPPTFKGSIAGVDLDLLMEPSKAFPGTIAPKVEVSTKTTIEETLCVCVKPVSNTVIVNPKLLTSSQERVPRSVCRKVCHSIGYSRKRRPFISVKTRPIFCYRRAEDDLILRKPKYTLDNNTCRCRQSKSLERKKIPCLKRKKKVFESREKECPCTVRLCSCGSGHRESLCPVCAKYKGCFSTHSETETKDKSGDKSEIRTTLFDRNCYQHSKNNRCSCCRPVAFATGAEDKSDSTADSNHSDSELERRRVCSCNTEKKPSLAEKLHAKLTKTLSSIPRSIEWTCYDNEYECECCDCPRPSRAKLYRDLQTFYGDLYEKAKSKTGCVPACAGSK